MFLKSKAQVSTELLLMISAAFAIGIVFLAALSYFYSEKIDEKNIEISKELLISIETELLTASKVLPGYERVFYLPETLNNKNYSVEISGGDIILTYGEIDFIGISPNVTGNLVKGNNTIRNVDGKVCLQC